MLAGIPKLHFALCCVLFACFSNSAFAQLQPLNVGGSDVTLTDVWMVDANIGYAAGEGTYKTTNGGITWTLLPAFAPSSPVPNFEFGTIIEQHLYFTDADHGISAGWNFFTNAEQIIVTNDGGATWTTKHHVNPNHATSQTFEERLRFLERVATNRFISGGYRGRILLSTDGGNTWTTPTTNTTRDLEDVSFIDASVGFIGGHNVILKTTDGGSTWTKTDINYNINNIKAFSATDLLATTLEGIIIKSTNGGQTWSQGLTVNYTETLTDIEFIDNQIGYVVSTQNLYKTTNGGSTFQSTPIVPTGFLSLEMQALSENKFYLATAEGKILFNNNTALPYQSINGFYGQGSFCKNATGSFKNIGNPAYSYKWYINNVEVAQTFDFSYTFANAGSFAVKLVSDNGPEPRTITKYVNVIAPPAIPNTLLYNQFPDTVEIGVFPKTLMIVGYTNGNYYQLFRNGAAQTTRMQHSDNAPVILYMDALTDAGTFNYILREEAVNECGTGTKDTPFRIVAIDKPRRLSDIDIHHAPNKQVLLSWGNNSTIATDYLIERRLEPGGSWSAIATVPLDPDNLNEYTDATVAILKTYSYRVAAVNAKGRSPYSDVKSINIYDKIVYVRKGAVGKNNGLSWTDAFKEADDAVNHSEADLEIWVAKGTYSPTKTWILSGKGMYGGFVGGESNRNQQNSWTNKTVLDVNYAGGSGVAQFMEIMPNSILDGFTVTRALYGINTQGSIHDCTIENGGTSITMTGESELARCIVRNNSEGIQRYGNQKIFSSIIYNNIDPGIYTWESVNSRWQRNTDYELYAGLYHTIVARNNFITASTMRAPGRNNLSEETFNDPLIDGPTRRAREFRVMTYLAGADNVWGNDDDIFYWPDARLIDKAATIDPSLYAGSDAFTKDLFGNDRTYNGKVDVGPVEYTPDTYPRPPSPTFTTTQQGTLGVFVDAHWPVVTDPTVTRVWLCQNSPNGDEGVVGSYDLQTLSANMFFYPINQGYSISIRYERNRIVSLPSAFTEVSIPKVSGAVPFNDISMTMGGVKSLPTNTNDGRLISYTLGDPSMGEYFNGGLTPRKAGTTTITLSIAENNLYNAFTITKTLTIDKGSQYFPLFPNNNVTVHQSDRVRTYPATSSQGLPLTYVSNNPGVATQNGNVITFNSPGNVTFTVSQAGNENFAPISKTLDMIVTVLKSDQTLSISWSNKTFGDDDFTPPVTASSGFPVTFTSNQPTVATTSGSVIHITGAGTARITATQSGTSFFNAVSGSFDLIVEKATEFITFAPIHDQVIGTTIDLDAHTVKQNTAAVFTLSSNKATLTGNKLTLVTAGQISITASSATTSNFLAPESSSQTICALPVAPTITLNGTILTSTATENKWYFNGVLKSELTGNSITANDEGTFTARAVVETCVSDVSNAVVFKKTTSDPDPDPNPDPDPDPHPDADPDPEPDPDPDPEPDPDPDPNPDPDPHPDPVTGINDGEVSSIYLYPNPVSTTLYVDGLTSGDHIRILNVIGQQKHSVISNGKNVEVDVRDFAQGIYYVTIDNKGVVLRFVR